MTPIDTDHAHTPCVPQIKMQLDEVRYTFVFSCLSILGKSVLIVALAAGLLTQFFPCCVFAIRSFSKVSATLVSLSLSLCIPGRLLHLLVTLVFQLWLMLDMEKLVGSIRMAILYMGSGVAGNLASCTFMPYLVDVGTWPAAPS